MCPLSAIRTDLTYWAACYTVLEEEQSVALSASSSSRAISRLRFAHLVAPREALPGGQTEAARSLGMSYSQTMRQIVLPQALYNMLPSMLSQFVSLIKDTSIGYVISVQELTFSAQQVNNSLL